CARSSTRRVSALSVPRPLVPAAKRVSRPGRGISLGSSRNKNNEPSRSVLARADAIADDRALAERLGRFQPMQALNQHKAHAIRSHKDRLLADFEHAGGDFVNALLL